MRDDYFSRHHDGDDDPDGWLLRHTRADERLHHLVYVDGRLVDSWTAEVTGTRWERHARRFDEERRPVVPPSPPTPAHERVLAWLDGLVGGRTALLALTDAPAPPLPPPTFDDTDDGAAFAEVADHLDRIVGAFFDSEVSAALDWAQQTFFERRPSMFSANGQAANATAGGLVWVVGRANGLFVGALRQQTIQRELWLRPSLSSVGQRIAPALRGISLAVGHRPLGAPDLAGFAEPALLTASTRRELVAWRDRALEAAEVG